MERPRTVCSFKTNRSCVAITAMWMCQDELRRTQCLRLLWKRELTYKNVFDQGRNADKVAKTPGLSAVHSNSSESTQPPPLGWIIFLPLHVIQHPHTKSYIHRPNVIVEWLTLRLRTEEVPSSNLGSETRYPKIWFTLLFSVTPRKCRDSILNYYATASFHILSNS
jgi:hypothetical protein